MTALAQLVEDSHIDDVLVPDQFMVAGEETGDSAWFDQGTGVSGVILDEQGDAIEGPCGRTKRSVAMPAARAAGTAR